MAKYICLLLMVFSIGQCLAQDLYESQQFTDRYLFRIAEAEAASIVFNENDQKMGEELLHSLVKVIPRGGPYYHPSLDSSLQIGHYLLASLQGEKVNYSMIAISPFRVEVIENNTDLVLQVWEAENKIVEHAEIRAGKKRLRFDAKTQTYRCKKTVLKEFLSVKINEFTAYYEVENTERKKGWKKRKIKSRLLYGTPEKFIVRPIRYLVLLPIHGTKSIINKHPQGVISSTHRFLLKIADKVECLFDTYNCDGNSNRYGWEQLGYCITSQPKYKPGDTVKVKAYIADKKGRPLDKELDLRCYGWPGGTIAKIKPYAPGAYEYQFVLHDSLKLKLDRNYSLSFRFRNRFFQHADFRLEEYDLGKLTLKVDAEEEIQYANLPFQLEVKARDENDLPILDGRLKVKITRTTVQQFLEDQLFIPKVLWEQELALDTDESTFLTIPDSIFPRANLGYKVEIQLVTSDNEVITENFTGQYRWKKEVIDIALEKDSVLISALINSSDSSIKATVYNRLNPAEVIEIALPGKVKLNPQANMLFVRTAEATHSFQMWNYDSELKLSSHRTADSLHLVIANPRKLAFSYFLYKGKHEIKRGFGKELKLSRKASAGKNYLFSLQYLWGGRVVTKHFNLPFDEQKIALTLKNPNLIFPGQTTAIQVQANDAKGKPMPGLDITAHGLTAKFKYEPVIPKSRKKRKKKEKKIKNNYKLTTINRFWNSGIGYDFWKEKANIEENEYYRFLFPQDDYYTSIHAVDDSITQFAPFVVDGGEIQPIHVIYLNNRPVYFNWSTNERPYSFQASPGYHQIELRTDKALIRLDSVYIRKGVKTIFSITENQTRAGKTITKQKPILSLREKQLLYPYIFSYQRENADNLSYLKQHRDFILLSPNTYANRQYLAGPLAPGLVTYHRPDRFTTHFNFESFYKYEFAKGLLKMRSEEYKGDYPDYPEVLNTSANKNFKQRVLGQDQIDDKQDQLLQRKIMLGIGRDAVTNYSKPSGELQLNLSALQGNRNLQALFFFDSANMKLKGVQNALQRDFYRIDEGIYRLILLYEDATYRQYDSLQVLANGLNYYLLKDKEFQPRDEMSSQIDSLIEHAFTYGNQRINKREKKKIQEVIINKYKYDGPGKILRGKVIDEETGDELIGATIFVPGIEQGSSTDLDGNFAILVPFYIDELDVSYAGYAMQKVTNIDAREFLTIKMEEGVLLEEVVVVGYAAPNIDRDNTTTGGVITSEQIRNLPTRDISSLAATTAGVSIVDSGDAISIRGSRADGTDYYIDGIRVRGSAAQLSTRNVKDYQVIEGQEAMSVYGVNKVVLITTNKDYLNPAFYEAAKNASSIRNNFSDEAFWQPRLLTDEQGQVNFSVTFPDDITKWDLHFLAMSAKGRAGLAQTAVRAMKPLSAQLSLPKFLLTQDTTAAIAKTFNYLGDSIQLKNTFTINEQIVEEQNISLSQVNIQEFPIASATVDTLDISFKIEKADGYLDGEKREIPILPRGLEIEKGVFYLINKDSTFNISEKFDQDKPVTIYAKVDQLNLVRQQMDRVIRYKYLCNEQLASKLLVLLREKELAKLWKEEFEYEEQLQEIIKRLLKNRNSENLWGWWANNNYSPWINNHVARALMKAMKAGYAVGLDMGTYAKVLTHHLQIEKAPANKMFILQNLLDINAAVDEQRYFSELDTTCTSFRDRLQLQYLKTQLNTPADVQLVLNNLQSDIFGNVYLFEEIYIDTLKNKNNQLEGKGSRPLPENSASRPIPSTMNRPAVYRNRVVYNKLQSTLLAYTILKRDSTADHSSILEKMRSYFFSNQHQGYWRNTYEAVTIIETIWEDLVKQVADLSQKPKLKISGDLDTLITRFPFEIKVAKVDALNFAYEGYQPIYFTAYQHHWLNEVEARENDFRITTRFAQNNSGFFNLQASESETLMVIVEVKKDADYVMIEVPIPAGCAYASKKRNYGPEVHREYFKNKVAIFCRQLNKGIYHFPIELRAKYNGQYGVNPAKASLMYFPTFYANTEMKEVEIE